MKIRVPLILSLLLLLSACSSGGGQSNQTAEPPENSGTETQSLHLVATSYPVYMLTREISNGTGNTVELLVSEATSCLHDYTLTTTDMKLLETADVILLSGAGLEEFMESALESTQAVQIDSAAQIDLLEYNGNAHTHDEDEEGHAGHTHDLDPHVWMDLSRYEQMGAEIAARLSELDAAHAAQYAENWAACSQAILQADEALYQKALDVTERNLITFHDGFAYFAARYDFTILRSIEEEAGSEASAKDVQDIMRLITSYQLSVIYVEQYGSTATAASIARETGVDVRTLDMCMSGDKDADFDSYLARFVGNISVMLGEA